MLPRIISFKISFLFLLSSLEGISSSDNFIKLIIHCLCRTIDELSCCIDQLEAEVDGSVCSRHVICNGEVADDSQTGDSLIGCMKCHKDNAYEQVTTLLHPYTLNNTVLICLFDIAHYTLLPYLAVDNR